MKFGLLGRLWPGIDEHGGKGTVRLEVLKKTVLMVVDKTTFDLDLSFYIMI